MKEKAVYIASKTKEIVDGLMAIKNMNKDFSLGLIGGELFKYSIRFEKKNMKYLAIVRWINYTTGNFKDVEIPSINFVPNIVEWVLFHMISEFCKVDNWKEDFDHFHSELMIIINTILIEKNIKKTIIIKLFLFSNITYRNIIVDKREKQMGVLVGAFLVFVILSLISAFTCPSITPMMILCSTICGLLIILLSLKFWIIIIIISVVLILLLI